MKIGIVVNIYNCSSVMQTIMNDSHQTLSGNRILSFNDNNNNLNALKN